MQYFKLRFHCFKISIPLLTCTHYFHSRIVSGCRQREIPFRSMRAVYHSKQQLLFEETNHNQLLRCQQFVGALRQESVHKFTDSYFLQVNFDLQGRLSYFEIRNVSSHVKKYFTHSLPLIQKFFSTLEEKFCTSAQPCNILFRSLLAPLVSKEKF